MWEYRARVLRVVDGDTYDLDVDLGFYVRVTIRVRLRGASCPETRAPGGLEATAFVMQAFAAQGDRCVVVTSADPARSFERWVARVTLPNGTDLAALLVARGHAVES